MGRFFAVLNGKSKTNLINAVRIYLKSHLADGWTYIVILYKLFTSW